MPVRVTIYEVVNIIKKQANEEILQPVKYGVMRSMGTFYAIHLFSVSVIFRRIKTRKNKIFLMKRKDDPVNRPRYLNSDIML